MLNDTYHTLDGVVFGNRTADDDLYRAMHNIRIKPDPDLYPPGFDFYNYSGYIHQAGHQKVTNDAGQTEETVDIKDLMAEVDDEDARDKARDREAWERKQKEKRDNEETIEESEEAREKAEMKEVERKERERAMEAIDTEIRKMDKTDADSERVKGEEEKLKEKVEMAENQNRKEEIKAKNGSKEETCKKEKQYKGGKERDAVKGVQSHDEKNVEKESIGNETHVNVKVTERNENIEFKTNEKVDREIEHSNENEKDKDGKINMKNKEEAEEKNQEKDVKEKRKRRQVVLQDIDKEEKTNQILRDMIVDDEYRQQMDELKNKIHDKAHIKNSLYFNFEHKDWYKRYKRELNEAFNELNINMDDPKLFDRNIISRTVDREHMGHRSKRNAGDYEKEKDDFTKQLGNFEINQANIKSLIDKGIGLNMQKAMKLSIDYAQKAFVNSSSSLDESVQRFFIMKQEYMNLIDKWYHGVVIDLPNYLKSQERKKINLSFDDDQPSPEEREKLNKLNEYERIVDREFAEVGIHYGKTLLNNYCDMDDLFYKYHRENNQVPVQTVFNEANTKELLRKENIAA